MPPRRPVLAYHLILTCYGFWLPNDPRGSGSTEVWSEALKPFGPATKVSTSRSVAHVQHDRAHRVAAKQALQRPPVRLTGMQAQMVGNGFGMFLKSHDLPCYACAILPDHAHLVLGRSTQSIERVAIGLKAAAVHALLQAELHPHQTCAEPKRPKVWARGSRHPFLFDEVEIHRAVRYVAQNPTHAGLPPQKWLFVRPVEPRTK